MSPQVAEHCKQKNWTTYEEHISALCADGRESNISEGLEGDTWINNRRIKHHFLVLPGCPHNVILGKDFLDKIGFQAYIMGSPIKPVKLDLSETNNDCIVCCTGKPNNTGLHTKTTEQQQQLQKFPEFEMEKFNGMNGVAPLIEHEIKLLHNEPIKQKYRPRNPAMQKIIDEEITKMLQDGIVEPSNSPWSSPLVIVRKKDGKPRVCVDFRKVNKITERDAYPLPQIHATINKLRGAKYISKIDLKNGYWQVKLTEKSKPITAFTVPGRGLMQFKVLPFGLHSAPATFQKLLDTVIEPEMKPYAYAYLDDIVVVSETFEKHLEHLRKTFEKLRKANLKMNLEKCEFCVDRITYLGHIIDKEGIHTDPDKVRAIMELPAPKKIKSLRRFLGMVTWYRRFIPNTAKITEPLNRLLKKGTRWKWESEQQKAFETLKQQLCTTPVLACPDFSKAFTLQTDASKSGIGGVLTQEIDGRERVIAYVSRTTNGAEKNYSVTELECLGVVWCMRKLREYLEGYHFTVITDHQSLQWLQKLDSPSGRLARWALETQQSILMLNIEKGQKTL